MNIEIKPIRKETLPEKIISEIKSLIESGQVAHGTRLPSEREFSRMLGVSRPSLREALKVLSVLGIIEHRHGEGTFLTEDRDNWPIEPFSVFFSIKKGALIDIYEARQGLEVKAAALAAERRTKEDLQKMTRAINKMKQSVGEVAMFLAHDLEFHRSLVSSTKNPVLIDLLEKIYKIHFETRDLLYATADNYEVNTQSDLEKHVQLLTHIAEGNAAAASQNIQDHLEEVQQRIMKATPGQRH